MKKIDTYSAQYKIIQPRKNNSNPLTSALSSTPNPQSIANSLPNKNNLTKDRQEFINNISASGFKQFNL